ncbi:hypothetical protein [Parabacteroides bouchesdurhonensis]|uniref:hypothetical protein n=1 Tax=Parabacteroides bouchesdurhonensis TaxID=1936995 RepID=UPI000E4BBB38|nr:hypothetical protein [Parabacteroides bouchesdurhonensis]RHJ94923.1 hypothetical protein DW095_00330 [Bacteroides sp. AM07-16]
MLYISQFYKKHRIHLLFLRDVYKYCFIRPRRKGLWMSPVYSDHMVLQRNKTLKIRGHAKAGARIEMAFAGNTYHTYTRIDGNWCITVPPMEAGGPYTMLVRSGRRKLLFKDIKIGEVWIVAGMSCMEMVLGGSDSWQKEKAAWLAAEANNNQLFDIRYWTYRRIYNFQYFKFPRVLCKWLNQYEIGSFPNWQVGDSKNIGALSGFGYYFAKRLNRELDVPVGMVTVAMGGCPPEAFIDRERLTPSLLEVLLGIDYYNDLSTRVLTLSGNYYKDQKYFEDTGFAFESQIRILDKFPVRGFLYGGFYNYPELVPYFYDICSTMVDSWRKHWEESLPVYCVQLSSRHNDPAVALFRDMIRRLPGLIQDLEVVVSYDTVKKEEDLRHPRNRHHVGERLARRALHHTYGRKEILPSGPASHEATLRENVIRITFDFSEGLRTSDGLPLREFEVAGEDECFMPAEAIIENDNVLVFCPDSLQKPVYIRYAWKDYTEANLVNAEGLPTSTFMDKIKVG